MQDCFNALLQSIELNPHSLASMFMLIKLCAHAEKYEERL